MKVAAVRAAAAAFGRRVNRMVVAKQAAVTTHHFGTGGAVAFATSSVDAVLRPLPPAAAHLLVTRYALQSADHVYNVEDWRLYKDFMLGLCGAPLAEVRAFHDAVVEPYESFIKSTSQSRTAIAFHATACGWNVGNRLTTLDYPVYHRFMNRVVREALTRAKDSPRLREVIDWVLGLKVVTGEQLGYALSTLLVQGKYELARWLMDTGAVSYRLEYSSLVRTAIHLDQLELAQLIYERGRGIRNAKDAELIAGDLTDKRCDLSKPIYAWAASLPEISCRLATPSACGK